jgi:hypothetical protein
MDENARSHYRSLASPGEEVEQKYQQKTTERSQKPSVSTFNKQQSE